MQDGVLSLHARIGRVAGALIEIGIYFLLFLTPFAFGGNELWVRGVIQIVAGFVVLVFLLDRMAATKRPQASDRRVVLLVGLPIALFALLVLFQTVPLPPSMLRSLSPSTYETYIQTVPGYAEGRDLEIAEIPRWLVERTPDLPEADPNEMARLYAPRVEGSEMTLSFPLRRSLSLVPSVTFQRLTIFLCWAGLFGVVIAHFNTREKLRRLVIAAVTCGFALSFFGIVQRLTWNGKIYWVQGDNYQTAFASFVNRNSYAAFAGTLIPVAVCMTLAAWGRVKEGDREAIPRLMLAGFAAVTITGGVFFSLSRGGILGTALSLALTLLLVLIYGGRRGRAPAIALMGTLAVFSIAFLAWIGPEQVLERIGTLSKGQSEPSFAHRVKAWERAIPMWQDFETFGTGLGTFRYAFLKYAPPGGEWWTTAHNEYLELLCETGIVGGALFVAGLAGYLFLVLRPWRLGKGSALYLYIGILTGIAGLLLHSAVSANLQTPANGLLLVLMGAVLLRHVLTEEQERREVPTGPRRIA